MDQKTDARTGGKTDTPVAELSFEEALAELERVVDALERGDVPLERSIDLYERGEALREICEKRLKDAQMRVDQIVAGANGEAIGTVPLDGQADGQSAGQPRGQAASQPRAQPSSQPGSQSGQAAGTPDSDDDIPF